MSRTFTRERCIPWLFSQAGVRIEGEPQAIAPAIDELRARSPHRTAMNLQFGGVACLFAAAIALMAGSRPARADVEVANTSARTIAGYALGGISVGAFVVGRRLGRNAPALAVLCVGRGAELDPAALASLVGDARKRLTDASWPEGQVWLISETPLAADGKGRADELKVRCFAPVNGQITEV